MPAVLHALNPTSEDIVWAFDPRSVAWENHPIPAPAARRWADLAPFCDPRDAVCYWQAGIEPEDWQPTDRLGDLLIWRDYQFTSPEITAWRQPAGLTPVFSDELWARIVMVWRHLGHTPESLEVHWRQGWRNPHDISRYPSPGDSDDAWSNERSEMPWAHNLTPTPTEAAQWRDVVAVNERNRAAAKITADGGLLSTLGVTAHWFGAFLSGLLPHHLMETTVDERTLSNLMVPRWRALLKWHDQYPNPDDLCGLFQELDDDWSWCGIPTAAAWVHHGFGPDAARQWLPILTADQAAVIVPFAVTADHDVVAAASLESAQDVHIMGARLRSRNQGE